MQAEEMTFREWCAKNPLANRHCDRLRFLSADLDVLQMVSPGGVNRLLRVAPEGAGNTTLATLFAAYYLDQNPRSVVHYFTYSRRMGEIGARKIKQYNPCLIKSDPDRVKGTSIHVSLCGSGADLTIVDSPFRNMQDALCPSIREQVWGALLENVRTRMNHPDRPILIFSPIYHEDDLIGRLVCPGECGEDWAKVYYPEGNRMFDAFRRKYDDA
ncbi:MAG: hypothetical protein H8F28_01330 [Fibrella sp.]|nr:hypothetical protein [Armatimonadota bacterium]